MKIEHLDALSDSRKKTTVPMFFERSKMDFETFRKKVFSGEIEIWEIRGIDIVNSPIDAKDYAVPEKKKQNRTRRR